METILEKMQKIDRHIKNGTLYLVFVLVSFLMIRDLIYDGLLDFLFTYLLLGVSFVLGVYLRGRIEKWDRPPILWKVCLAWYPSIIFKPVRKWIWK